MKTWVEKRDSDKVHQVKINPKKFSDLPAGCMMLIPSPSLVDCYVKQIPYGNFMLVKSLRQRMAIDNNAEMSCPLVTGIFLRIVSEAAFEELNMGMKLNAISPFWRVVSPSSKLATKLTCGIDFIINRQKIERIKVIN